MTTATVIATEGGPKPALWQRVDPQWVIIGVAVFVVAWLALVPLGFLLWQSFLTPQTAASPAVFTLDNYRTAYLDPETIRLFFNSIEYAVGSALMALTVGTGLAWMGA